MNWFKALWAAVKTKIVGFFPSDPKKDDALGAHLDEVKPFMETAFKVAEQIATLTPTRSDDELLALAKIYGVPELFSHGMTSAQVKNLLLSAGEAALMAMFPGSGVTATILRSAIDLALGTLKHLPEASE